MLVDYRGFPVVVPAAKVKIIQRMDGSGVWVYLDDKLLLAIDDIQEFEGISKIWEKGLTPPADLGTMSIPAHAGHPAVQANETQEK
jgi:hypothetical protein